MQVKRKLFKSVKSHPLQAGFFRRGVAFLLDYFFIILFSVILFVLFLEGVAVFHDREGPISTVVSSIKKGKSVSSTIDTKERNELTVKDFYLRILKSKLNESEYETAEKMTVEGLKSQYHEIIENSDKIIVAINIPEIFYELLIGYLYFIVFFRFGGRTPAKRIFNLKVIDLNGEKKLGWYQCFERAHGYAASTLCFAVGFFQVFWDKRGLSMHDRLAQTTVIKLPKSKKRRIRKLLEKLKKKRVKAKR